MANESADILRRLQALEAKFATLSRSQAQQPSQQLSSRTNLFEVSILNESVLVAEDTLATSTGWVSYDATGQVPSTARFLYIRFWVQVDGEGTTGSIDYRPNGDGSEFQAVGPVRADDAAGVDSDSSALILPWDRDNQSFDYQMTSTGDADYKIQIIGYIN